MTVVIGTRRRAQRLPRERELSREVRSESTETKFASEELLFFLKLQRPRRGSAPCQPPFARPASLLPLLGKFSFRGQKTKALQGFRKNKKSTCFGVT